jgi:hypothetical protein
LATDEPAGFVGSSADLGSAFHAISATIRQTLQDADEPQMATEECVVIAREVLANGSWVLTADDYRWLIQMVLSFADYQWPVDRFLAIERRLAIDIPCPDGELRTFTGTPDLVMADPPNGLIVVDDKTGLAKPRTPKELPPEGEAIRGIDYLHEGGYFQLVGYGTMLMLLKPRVQYVILREQNYRWNGPPREAVLARGDLEHTAPYLGLVMMQLDTALREGEDHELAKPRPGAHCTSRCPVARSCPVPQEQRGLGVLTTPEDAMLEADRWVVIRALDKQMRESLKAHHEATEQFIPVAGGFLGWHDKPSGGREFAIKEPAP